MIIRLLCTVFYLEMNEWYRRRLTYLSYQCSLSIHTWHACMWPRWLAAPLHAGKLNFQEHVVGCFFPPFFAGRERLIPSLQTLVTIAEYRKWFLWSLLQTFSIPNGPYHRNQAFNRRRLPCADPCVCTRGGYPVASHVSNRAAKFCRRCLTLKPNGSVIQNSSYLLPPQKL
jgi:hypothetical protein